jgi:hypothetical protein
MASIGNQRAESRPIFELWEAISIGEEVGASWGLAEATDMSGKGTQERFEGEAGLTERLAMTLVVARRRDGEERPGWVETANREERTEAEPHEDRASSTEFANVMVKGKDDPASESATGMREHGVGKPRGSSIGNRRRGSPGGTQEEIKKIHRSIQKRKDKSKGNE